MAAKEGVLIRAGWDVRSKKYVPIAAETGWCRLW
jgi:hypothetical protein